MWLWHLWHSTVPESTLVQWGAVSLRWYGVLFALGTLAGYLVVRREWRERGWPQLELDALVLWLVVGGLVGARLLDVFFYEWWYFREHLGAVAFIWQGGLAFHGGLAFGALVLWWWARRTKRSWLALADTFAPALALAQAIGRWGNYFNQELFGLPTSLPWGIPIVPLFRPAAYAQATYFHPVFLYESLGLLAITAVLWRCRRLRWRAGQRFALYLVLGGVLRLALEWLRIDEQFVLGGLRAGVWVALATIATGVGIWLRQRSRQPA